MRHPGKGTTTTEPRWQHYAPLGAVGFLLMLGLGAALVGETSPNGNAPEAEIATYFAEHQGGHLVNMLLGAIGAFVMYPWFLAALWRRIRVVEGGEGLCAPVALIGGIALLGPLTVQLAGWGAAALQVGDRRDPSVAATLFDLGSTGFLLFPLPAALLVLATSLANRSGPLLPVWIARAGYPLAVVMVLGALPFGQFMVLLFGLWMIAVSVVLMRKDNLRRAGDPVS